MKKVNFVFVGECVIILLLLVILGILLQDKGGNMVGKETAAAEEIQETDSMVWKSSASGLVDVQKETEPISESVSDNAIASLSANDSGEPKSMEGKKIVVFGDSIWSAARGADGISEYIQAETGAQVYNCAIGGTTAALVEGESNIEDWTSNSFNGMIYVARHLVPAENVISDEAVLEIIRQVNFEEMDYVIISYGLNDFFSGVSIYPTEYYELTNYVGALRNGINKLKENYPNLQIILVSPTYTKMFEGEKEFEIGNYVEAARGVSQEMNVSFLDMFHILGNNAETRTEHLGDGVHMSAEGRKIYADAVVNYLEELDAMTGED